ncbi:MAG TPA: MalY/PatB family protein, partial [Anaerolineales bacterium]|nr:MalY/PatB family protein [Anaerolineales bacterium]
MSFATPTYNFDTLPDRKNSESAKWGFYGPDVLPMWVADMDFLSPPQVVEALIARAQHGVYGYPQEPAGLRSAVTGWLARRFQWQVTPDELVFVPGVVKGFHLALRGLLTADQGVLVQTPVYPPILKAAADTGRVAQAMELSLLPDGAYAVDWERFEAAFTPQTGAFILCHPHNPIGKVFSADELGRMAEVCLRRGVLMISDEIHADLVFSESRHIPLATLAPEIAQQTITFIAPSKTFNLAGLQCSVAVILNPELRRRYLHAVRLYHEWVNLFGQIAAEAAYRTGAEWLDALLDFLEATRDFTKDFVERELPGVTMAAPQGTYLAWLDCRQARLPENAHKFFLEKAHVAVNDGADFG